MIKDLNAETIIMQSRETRVQTSSNPLINYYDRKGYRREGR
jgi:hypothetical protein